MPTAEASAPASAANLGPGFDVLALALELRCRVKAVPADAWAIDHGAGQRPDNDSDDAVMAAARRAVGDGRPLRLVVRNHIPIGRGMGSSAAALAAGAGAALAAHGLGHDVDRVFDIVAAMEGHADNAAASVYGGLVMVPAEGRPHRLPIHPGIRPIVAVSDEVFLTADARKAVPDDIPTAVAVRTVARAAALVAGFLTADPTLLRAAHGDELHELPRSHHQPETQSLVKLAMDAGALHAAWSGSGPSVVALVEAGAEAAVAAALAQDSVRVLTLGVATSGLLVSLT